MCPMVSNSMVMSQMPTAIASGLDDPTFQPLSSLNIGFQGDKYEIMAVLGSGSFGEVREASRRGIR